ncbi:MAG: PIN domain nuclease, partial [Cyanobacteria bacterium P01_E01_bin.48]
MSVLPQLRGPLVTTWACFTEAMYLLGRTGNWYAQDKLWQYVRRKAIQIHCQDMDEQVHMQQLMQQ